MPQERASRICNGLGFDPVVSAILRRIPGLRALRSGHHILKIPQQFDMIRYTLTILAR